MEQKQKKKETPPPRYNEAFKAGTVRKVTEQGRESREVAKDLGICIDTLRSWLRGCSWVRLAVPPGNSNASGNRRRKSAPCASSLWRKMRSLIF